MDPQNIQQTEGVAQAMPENVIQMEAETDNTFTAESGKVFTIRPVNQIQLMDLGRRNQPNKPSIPVMVNRVGDYTQVIPNDQHPGYLKQMEDYQQKNEDYNNNQHVYLMRFAFTAGIVESPDQEWIEQYGAFFDDKSLLKYEWVMFHLNIQESAQLLTRIIGINTPTEEGVAESTEVFPVSGSEAFPVP